MITFRIKSVGLAAMMVAASVALSAQAFAGPIGRYWLTDESGFNNIWQFQGNTMQTFPASPNNTRHGPIIVDGNTNTVRSVEGGFGGGDGSNPGAEYDFSGAVQAPLNLNHSAHSGGRVIDAGFDGTHTYIVDSTSNVFRYNADFSGSGTFLFNVSGSSSRTPQGITYDTTTNTLWLSDYGAGRVQQFDLSGNELFSFAVVDNLGNLSSNNTALAYDFSDDTFWMNAHRAQTMGFGIGELWQFDRQGNFLQKIHGAQFGGPTSILYWGGEIYATGESHVSEASTLGLIGLGLVGLGFAARRRKTH